MIAPRAGGGPDLSARLAAQVRAIPEKPGVYLFHNARGEVIYVGKAASLRSRVRSYFGAPHSLLGKTRRLSAAIAEIAYVTTNTAQEALHLEATLCKQHQPLYNVRLKDDKHYPYLKIDVDEPWPRVYITRSVQRDGGRYFGPYANAKSVRTTLDIVKKLFPWRSCTKTITGTDARPCLDYYIRRCIAPCTSYCTPDEYRAVIDQVIHFLEGRTDLVLRDLRARMAAASEALQFEEAARIRDQIRAVERVGESQVIASTRDAQIDVFGLAQDGNEAIAQVLFVRGTKMTGGDSFPLTGTSEETPAAVLSSFLKQFYSDAIAVPRLVLTPELPDDAPLLQDWLRAKRGAAVEVRAPVRGEKRRLVAMAADNARESLQMQRVKWMADQGNTRAALVELEEALSLPRPPSASSATTSPTFRGRTRSRAWSSSATASRRARSTAASRSSRCRARTTSPRWRRCWSAASSVWRGSGRRRARRRTGRGTHPLCRTTPRRTGRSGPARAGRRFPTW